MKTQELKLYNSLIEYLLDLEDEGYEIREDIVRFNYCNTKIIENLYTNHDIYLSLLINYRIYKLNHYHDE